MDKTLKGIRSVRLDNRKVLRAPGPRTKLFERISCRLVNNNANISKTCMGHVLHKNSLDNNKKRGQFKIV